MTISLASKKLELRQDIIDHLEKALALAREGKVVDLILGYTDDDKGFFTVSSYENYLKAVGLATMLQRDVIDTGDVE